MAMTVLCGEGLGPLMGVVLTAPPHPAIVRRSALSPKARNNGVKQSKLTDRLYG
jgi:hypothetical protein